MPYPNEHSARVRDPGDFEKDSFRRVRLPGSDVWVIVGRLKGEKTTTVQTYRFPKDKFTEAEAKAWLKEQGIEGYLFEEAVDNRAHDVLMQTLERKVNGVYLTLDSFAPSVDAWNGIPLIFSLQHADQAQLAQDMLKEIERIGGRLIGTVADAKIETAGHPRLMARFDFEDEEADRLWKAGKLSHSTAFFANFDEGRRTVGPIQPNHVILFEETDSAQPGDMGAFILNMQGEGQGAVTMGDDGMELIDRLKRWVAMKLGGPAGKMSEGNGEDTMNDKEYEQKLASVQSEMEELNRKLVSKDAEMGNLQKAIEARDAEIKGLKDEVVQFRAKVADERWATEKAKLPVGFLKDKEEELRKLYETDPHAYYAKKESVNMRAGTAEEGTEQTNQAGDQPKRVDRWNPETKKYEVI